MTTKQLAEALGRPEKTVRTWAFKAAAKSAEAAAKSAEATPARPADWSLDEALAIVEVGLGKNAASLFRENATRIDLAPAVDVRLARLELLVEKLVGALATMVPARAAALPAPAEMEPRDDLLRLVRLGARRIGDYRGAWHELYEQFGLRYHRNIHLCAKNRGMDTLDYVESEGLMGELLSLAYHLFGRDA